MSSRPTAIITDLRAQLTDGKCIDVLTSKVPRPLAMEVRQSAERTGTTVSDWMMRAALEKILNDEAKIRNAETENMIRERNEWARRKKPQGVSQEFWNESIRRAWKAAINKTRK